MDTEQELFMLSDTKYTIFLVHKDGCASCGILCLDLGYPLKMA